MSAENPIQDGTESLAGDLLKGAKHIAEWLDEPERRVYYMINKGAIPAFKMAGVWYARKSSILAHFAKLEERAVR